MKLNIFLSTLILFFCASCSQKQEPLLGLKYGQEYSSVLSILQSENYNPIDNENVITVNSVTNFGFKWDYVRIDFEYYQLDCMRYTSAMSDTITQSQYNKLVSYFKDTYPDMNISEEDNLLTKFSDNTQTIEISLVKSDYSNAHTINILFKQIPSPEELARREKLRQSREAEINNQLQKLNEGMLEYMKCLEHDPYNLRNHYVDQVTHADNYLREHVDEMTPKQKEWYNRLKNVTF